MNIGNLDITNPKIGATEINKVFIGLNKVWERLLLDGLTGSTGAFSLRKLSSSYSGSAIQVRRASDNTTQDIGFVNNQLDVTSLNTFCSGTNGFVSIWYNQSDVSNNAIQATATNQPKIYDSVNGVELENGKPTIKFIKSNSNWLEVVNTSFGNIQNAISNFSVFKVNTGTTDFPVIFSKSYNNNGGIAPSLTANDGKLHVWIDGQLFSSLGNDIRGGQVLMSNTNLLASNGIKFYIDSLLISQQTTSSDLAGTNSYRFAIGRNNQDNSYYIDGSIQEILLFSNDQTANRTKIETDIDEYYDFAEEELVLDNLNGSTGGFSLRRLNSSYTGSAIQVRRASDNSTLDIGFVNNELDTASLTTFCTGTDGFVTIWYNQSDTSNNAVQSVAANQPRIYGASTGVQTENGKPAIVFDGNNDYLEVIDLSYGNIGDLLSTFIVHRTQSTGIQMLTSKGYVGEGEHMYYLIHGDYKSVIESQTLAQGSLAVTNQQNLFSSFLSTGSGGVNTFNNGTLYQQQTTNQDLTGNTTGRQYAIGYNIEKSTWHFNGIIQEIITFNSDLISDRLLIEADINTNYTIY